MIRLRGFAMLVNCVLPVLFVAGIGWASTALWTAIETELRPPVTQLIADAENLAGHARTAAISVEKGTQIVRAEAAKVQNSVTAIVEPLTSFRINVPAFNVPFLNLKQCKPNLKIKEKLNIGSCFPKVNVLAKVNRNINDGLKKAFAKPRAEFAKISASIERAQDEFDKLRPLADAFRAQAAQFEARAAGLAASRDRIATRVGGIVRIAGYALGALSLWAVLSYLLWIQDRLAIGWHMLRHGTRP